MTAYDKVYNDHCSRCHLRHQASCGYKNCSKEQFETWVKEAQTKINQDKRNG